MRTLPQETISEIIKLREQGLMYKEIAKKLGVLKYSVGRICRRYVRDLRYIALPRISEETIGDIIKYRRRGLKYDDIAEKVGYCKLTVMNICHEYCPGLEHIAHPNRTPKDVQRSVCALHQFGKSISEIKKKLNIGDKAVIKSLTSNGFVRKKRGLYIKHS